MEKIPVELKNAILTNKLLIFAGAGISYNLLNIEKKPLKGWSDLVENILHYLESKGYEVDYLIPLIKRYDPIRILDLIENSKNIPKKEIYKFLKDYFDLSPENNFDLHKKLFQLSNKIITTNYDNAFEIAVPLLRKNKAYKGKNYELTTHKDPNSVLLFKLHGCFEDADSMVLFPTNYKQLYENQEKDAEHSLLVLRNIIINRSVLFIGTGMGDFQINNIFKEIKRLHGEYNQNHFIITKNSLDSSLSFLIPVKINDYSDLETIVNTLIEIKNESESKESIKIIELQKQLEKAQREIEVLKNTSNKNQLLEREALKYFAKGVEFSISNDTINASDMYNTALELKSDLHEALYNWGTELGNLAKTKEGVEAEVLYREAFVKYQKAIDIKPDLHEALYNWGTDLGNLAQTKEAKEAEVLYREAFDKFQKVIDIYPEKYNAFNNWGICLGNLAQTKKGEEAEILYKDAIDKYQKAIDIKPDHHEALYNWGTELNNFAKAKVGKEAEILYWDAINKYQKAIDIKPDFHDALYNWGICLSNLAQTKKGEEAEVLYRDAIDKYQKAINIKPDKYNAFNNWGYCLGKLAKTKEGEETEVLYWDAIDKYQKAINIKPDLHEALYNWGTDLGSLAKTKKGKEAEVLYMEAFDKFQQAIEYGSSSYNFSCILALKGDIEEAYKYLELSLSKNEIGADFVEKDEDWKDYFKDEKFLTILKKYKG